MPPTPTFRADHVGSLFRPEALLQARRSWIAGTTGAGQLRAIEDEAIAAAVAGQEETGIDVITTGSSADATSAPASSTPWRGCRW